MDRVRAESALDPAEAALLIRGERAARPGDERMRQSS